MIFFDESISHCGDRRLARVWRNPEGRGSLKERMAYPQTLMLWGMISIHGTVRLVPVYGNMKKEEYKDIFLCLSGGSGMTQTL